MQQARWNRIETILDTALTLSGKERTNFVIDACDGDKDLLSEVYEILEAIEKSEQTAFLEGMSSDNRLFVEGLSDSSSASPDSLIGTRIGVFKISEQLGSGGMGAVYKAERSDGQFAQQVAVKLLQKGIQSEETLRRFRMEQEILASLKHPNIAQLYDGGVTGDGIPYLVMEFVDGVPIDRYCDNQKLTIDERLALFNDVCKAVQFAHANLVIHRDLKAQNIYVTPEGIVKVLDFGIAKLLDPKLTEQTLLKTRPGQKMWTPQYAAPEQVKGKPITTATDVYALGVLLYKLLTDTYPLDLKDKSIAEVERMIAEAAPVAPSQSVEQAGKQGKSAERRKTTEADLKKVLAGDLDALVLKALRKEPEYRYNSVGQLIEELDRYRDGLPLTARKDTAAYRMGKFYRRHKTGVAVTIIMVLIIAGLSGFYTWRIAQERDEANLQAQKAELTTQFLTSLFVQAEPEEAQRAELTAREILDRGAEKIVNQLQDQPEVQAKVLSVVGRAYYNINLLEKADSLVSIALEIFQNLENNQSSNDFAFAQWVMARIKSDLGNYEEAERRIRSALSIYKTNQGENAPETKQCLLDLSIILHKKREFNKTNTNIENWASIKTKESRTELASRLLDEGQIAYIRGNYKEAVAKIRNALEIRLEIYGELHAFSAIAMDRLSSAINRWQYYSPLAESLQTKAVKINNIVYDEPHAEWAFSIFKLGRIKKIHGEYTEANKLFQRAIKMMQSVRGSESLYMLNIRLKYAHLLLVMGKIEAARQLYHELEFIINKKYDKMHLFSIRSRERLALILEKENKLNEASQLYQTVINDYDKKYSKIHRYSSSARVHYGYIQMRLGNLKKAEKWITETVKFLSQSNSDVRMRLWVAEQTLGLLRLEQQQFEEAEALLKSSYEFFERFRGPKSNYTQESLEDLVKLYKEWGKPDKVQKFQALILERRL